MTRLTGTATRVTVCVRETSRLSSGSEDPPVAEGPVIRRDREVIRYGGRDAPGRKGGQAS
ncbi:hypothetical protein AB0O67_26200 [Streptomyces sp. NPDC086077]|uniref:hypothetical protein n=1 Tax=Streptomyces sp. NPDC086077 TaxID=3154862 RepID=UPI00343E3970